MSLSMPRRVTVSSKKVAELVFDKLLPAMHGQPEDAAILSMICAAAIIMRPNIPNERLQHVIDETSGFLVTMMQDEVAPADAN